MDEAEIRRIIQDEFRKRDAQQRNEIIAGDEFAWLKSDIAQNFEANRRPTKFPWDNILIQTLIEDRLWKKIAQGLHRGHSGWTSERASIIQIIRNHL
jgi:hypothetical protein